MANPNQRRAETGSAAFAVNTSTFGVRGVPRSSRDRLKVLKIGAVIQVTVRISRVCTCRMPVPTSGRPRDSSPVQYGTPKIAKAGGSTTALTRFGTAASCGQSRRLPGASMSERLDQGRGPYSAGVFIQPHGPLTDLLGRPIIREQAERLCNLQL